MAANGVPTWWFQRQLHTATPLPLPKVMRHPALIHKQYVSTVVHETTKNAVKSVTRFENQADVLSKPVVRGISLPLQNIFDGHCM
jgi:hypothetical protein